MAKINGNENLRKIKKLQKNNFENGSIPLEYKLNYMKSKHV
jgi:hypothetical protein